MRIAVPLPLDMSYLKKSAKIFFLKRDNGFLILNSDILLKHLVSAFSIKMLRDEKS
jgi:hypothetical protein